MTSEAAAKAGFEGVEFLFPHAHVKLMIADALTRAGLKTALRNLPAGDWATGERGIACQPRRIDEFREGVNLAMEYVQAPGWRQLNCLAGIAPADANPQDIERTFVNNLRFAAPWLAGKGSRLLIEPVDTFDIPGCCLNRTAQASRIIDEEGSDNLCIQYDIRPVQHVKGELSGTIARHPPRIAHMQLAAPRTARTGQRRDQLALPVRKYRSYRLR